MRAQPVIGMSQMGLASGVLLRRHSRRAVASARRGAAMGGRELGPFEVDEERVERGDEREGDAVDPLAITAPRDIGFPGAAEDTSEGVAETQHLTAVERVARGQLAVAVEPEDHVAVVAIDEMQQWLAEPLPRAGQGDLRMNAAGAPALASGLEQACLGRRPVISAPAEADPPPTDVVGDWDEEIAVLRGGDGAADLVGEAGRHALVRVDLENPRAPARGNAGVAPRPF